jgi:hypothetical protein
MHKLIARHSFHWKANCFRTRVQQSIYEDSFMYSYFALEFGQRSYRKERKELGESFNLASSSSEIALKVIIQ